MKSNFRDNNQNIAFRSVRVLHSKTGSASFVIPSEGGKKMITERLKSDNDISIFSLRLILNLDSSHIENSLIFGTLHICILPL